MTNREKFEEVFGRHIRWSDALHPQILALRSIQLDWVDCAEEWMNEEYKTPTANVRESVHGVWAWHDDEYICNCSRCDYEIDAEGCIDPEGYVSTYKFCPNCGADMRGENGNE